MDGSYSAAPSRSSGRPSANIRAHGVRLCRLRSEVAHALETGRERAPRVHAFVSTVAAPLVANVAAAAGIDVSMSEGRADVEAMVPLSDAVLVNLGMLTGTREAAIEAAVDAAGASGVPFVLDPVKVDRSPARLELSRRLIAKRPAIVKGNAAEMAALGSLPEEVVAVTTGARDEVRFGGRMVALTNGTPLLSHVVATGCAAGVLMAGALGASRSPYSAALLGAGRMAVAGEEAVRASRGAGSFAAALLDVLGSQTGDGVARALSIARPAPDTTLYLVLGPDVANPEAVAQAAVRGGVTLIQWRDKEGGARAQLEAVARLAAQVSVPILVNDRADVALAGAADGLHVGEADAPAPVARQLLSDAPYLGATVQTDAHIEGIEACDYASIGGVFPTDSKANPRPPIGIDGFARLRDAVRARADSPVCAIAGIDADRARQLAQAGADGIAVMSAITKADDPEQAARNIAAAFAKGRQ